MIINEDENFSILFPLGINFKNAEDINKIKTKVLGEIAKAIKKAGGADAYLY